MMYVSEICIYIIKGLTESNSYLRYYIHILATVVLGKDVIFLVRVVADGVLYIISTPASLHPNIGACWSAIPFLSTFYASHDKLLLIDKNLYLSSKHYYVIQNRVY